MRFQKLLGPRERVAAADLRRSPQVSVVMPTTCGNRDGHLTRAIDSILAQTYRDFELVIVDDGSPESSQGGTETVCRAYAARDSRVVYMRYHGRCGLPALLADAAIIESRAAYVALMLDDWVWRADALESLFTAIESQATDVVHADVDATSETATPCLEVLTCRNIIPIAAVLCRRDLFERIGLFDPHLVLQRTCDWDLWLRAMRLGATFSHLQKTVAQRQEGLRLTADTQTADWDHKTSYAYMTCAERLHARTQSLLPANIERYDVFDRRALTRYLRNSHEWKVTEKLIYEPYFAAQPHLAAIGESNECEAEFHEFPRGDEFFPHCVKERMRVLLVSNVYHKTVNDWMQTLTANRHAIVVCCSESQASLFAPGDIDLIVLFDCASPAMLDVLSAYEAAGVPITYCIVFGETDFNESGFGEIAPWNHAQRTIAERLKSIANSVLDLSTSSGSADGRRDRQREVEGAALSVVGAQP